MIAHATAEPWRVEAFGLGDLTTDISTLIALIIFALVVVLAARWLERR